jgi:hypothetical protein
MGLAASGQPIVWASRSASSGASVATVVHVRTCDATQGVTEGGQITMSQSRFTIADAERIGTLVGIDWNTAPFGPEQYRIGLEVELEHGSHDPETNVTDDDETLTGKIAWAHLKELPDYYTRLAAMEAEAGS